MYRRAPNWTCPQKNALQNQKQKAAENENGIYSKKKDNNKRTRKFLIVFFNLSCFRRQSANSSDGTIDENIDKNLKQSALRNNLTPANVKNILQKVVKNDHVLAIVKLKEEEMERLEQVSKEMSKHKMDIDKDDEESTAPKLTRAKARALNKFPLPVAPIKETPVDSEVVALIQDELRSDDEDEEYHPGDEEFEVIARASRFVFLHTILTFFFIFF